MGGKSSSRSSTTNNNINIDGRLAVTENGEMIATQVYGDGNTVLDGGAIQGAFDTVQAMQYLANEQVARSQNMLNNNTKLAFQFANNMKADEDERILSKFLPYLVIAIGIIALAYVLSNVSKKGRKK